MSSHARLSPSAADRWFACPASVKACEQYPESKSSPAALDGTRTHLVLEHCLLNDVKPLDLVGEKIAPLPDADEDTIEVHNFIIDRDRALRVSDALYYIYGRVEAIGKVELIPERKVDAGKGIGRDDIKGTADVTLIGETELEIIDYKDGRSPVSPIENKQMSIYAVGALLELTKEQRDAIEKVTLTIIQPKLNVQVSSWVTIVEELNEFMLEMKEAADKTDQDDADFNAGDKQCQWCAHKGNCGTYVSYSTGGGMAKVINLSIQDSNGMTNDQIADIVRKAPEIRKMLDAVEKEALRRVESGQEVKGIKVIKTSGRRKWVLPEDDVVTKLQRMGVPKAASIIKKVVSPAQVEKLIWQKGGEDKKLSERQIDTLMSEYVEVSGGSYKVVADDKAGTPVSFDLSSHFNKTENIIEGESEKVNELPNWLK